MAARIHHTMQSFHHESSMNTMHHQTTFTSIDSLHCPGQLREPQHLGQGNKAPHGRLIVHKVVFEHVIIMLQKVCPHRVLLPLSYLSQNRFPVS